jgi:hypothetical protein
MLGSLENGSGELRPRALTTVPAEQENRLSQQLVSHNAEATNRGSIGGPVSPGEPTREIGKNMRAEREIKHERRWNSVPLECRQTFFERPFILARRVSAVLLLTPVPGW